MPTHKDFPDSYLRGTRRRGPAGWSTATLVAIIVGIGLAAGVGGALLLRGNPDAAAGHPPAVQRAPTQPGRRHRQQRLRERHPADRVTPKAVAAAPRPKPVPLKPRLLVVGVSLPGHGRAPELIVTGAGNNITARSRSSVPLVISSDSHYGQPLRTWTVLDRADIASRVVITGHRYGYCFAQAAGHGFAATRACATTRWHQTVNGARLPDGAPLTTYVRFLVR